MVIRNCRLLLWQRGTDKKSISVFLTECLPLPIRQLKQAKILTINSGSSSMKFLLFDADANFKKKVYQFSVQKVS
jgi:hypothetical protein